MPPKISCINPEKNSKMVLCAVDYYCNIWIHKYEALLIILRKYGTAMLLGFIIYSTFKKNSEKANNAFTMQVSLFFKHTSLQFPESLHLKLGQWYTLAPWKNQHPSCQMMLIRPCWWFDLFYIETRFELSAIYLIGFLVNLLQKWTNTGYFGSFHSKMSSWLQVSNVLLTENSLLLYFKLYVPESFQVKTI